MRRVQGRQVFQRDLALSLLDDLEGQIHEGRFRPRRTREIVVRSVPVRDAISASSTAFLAIHSCSFMTDNVRWTHRIVNHDLCA